MVNLLSKEKRSENRIYIKGVIIIILALVLLIPSSMIESLIYERQNLYRGAVNEVSKSWGASQTITSPVLAIPFTERIKGHDDKLFDRKDIYIVMPEALKLDADLKMTERKRSIYKVNLYTGDVTASGNIEIPEIILAEKEGHTIHWEEAFLTVGVSDVTAIQGAPDFLLDGQNKEVTTGVDLNDQIRSGFTIKNLNLDATQKEFNYNLKFKINGSQFFNVNPIAKRNEINVSSDWPSPSFQGTYLPQKHNIEDTGFTAHWKVSEFNRNFPGHWTGNKHKIEGQSTSVQLVNSVDDYHKNIRAIKYAILIIGLSFLLFFFIEMLSKMRIHPIQYVLVGIALVVFYTLLVALTEHIGFNLAYGISSSATIALIGVYCHSLVTQKKQAWLMILLLCFLYGYVYVILQLEDSALLVGSIGLFVILSGVMLFTRKVNFYALHQSKD